MWDLIAIGNPVYDRISTPYVSSQGRILSGCSTNACLAAVKLGLKRVGLIGSVGEDYRTRFINDLKRYGVTPAYIGASDETGGFGLEYKEDGDRTLDLLGKADPITTDNIPSHCLKAKMIAVGPILGEVSLELLDYIVENSSADVFIDPQGFLREIQPDGKIKRVARKGVLKKLAKAATFLKPNEHEAFVLTSSLNHIETAGQLVKHGSRYGIVTLADKGSIISDGHTTWQIPTFPTLARDPTGAGDTYMGSFIYSWLTRDVKLHEHAVFASAAASCMVEHTGPDFKMTLTETRKRVAKIHRLIEKINPVT
ncbi:MAG: carbohydrate kinase family protein [Candidatus Ranarchaeia archaeon]